MCFTFLKQPILRSLIGLITFLLLMTAPARSQSPVNYLDPADPSRGYWKLHTDHATRNTIVRLFNSRNDLVYEEIMPGQYIKLTDRTISRITETLELVAANKLILSKVKTQELTDGYPLPEAGATKADVYESTPESAPVTAVHRDYALVRIDANVLKETKSLLVQCDNPEQRRLRVVLRDDDGKTVFSESLNSKKYARKIEMATMRSGKYKLVVCSPFRTVPFTYSWHVMYDHAMLTIY